MTMASERSTVARPALRAVCVSRMRRSDSGYGSGASRMPFTRLNMAVVVPTPSASTRTTAPAKVGTRRRRRAANRSSDRVLMHESPAVLRLGSVDVGTVTLRVDERSHRVLRGGAGDKLTVPAPPSCMAGHPDVSGEAPQHPEAALEVGPLLWIPHPTQRHQVASAHDVQHAVTVTNGE